MVVVFLGSFGPPFSDQPVPERLGALAEGRVGGDHAVGGGGSGLLSTANSLGGRVAVVGRLQTRRLGQAGGFRGKVRLNDAVVCCVAEELRLTVFLLKSVLLMLL